MAYRQSALEEVRAEHPKYFEALNKHPRMLVGQTVPAIGRDGMETLRDPADAREWQDAVKHTLAAEIQDRAGRQLESNADVLTTLHASVELFQSNPDLIPMTKGFDKELADRFATMAKPYEVRTDGKLQGYSIPVQPLVEQLRAQVQAERARAAAQQPPAAPAAPAATRRGAAAQAPAEQPQAGISSKAGTSSEKEDFSTLFGTLGLPGLQI